MDATFQSTTIVANLTRDARVYKLSGEREVLRMRVATNHYRGRDSEGRAREHAEYHDLIAFAREGRFDRLMQADVLGKGAKILVSEAEIQKSLREVNGEQRLEVVLKFAPANLQVLRGKPLEETPVGADDMPPEEVAERKKRLGL